MSDTYLRQWAMLRVIPKAPRKIDVSTIKSRLEEEGFKTTKRTIQRDLKELSTIFPLQSDERSRPFGWQWIGNGVFDIPGIDPQTALAFTLLAENMQDLLPKASLTYLEPYFERSREVLNSLGSDSGIGHWWEKIKIVPRGLRLIPAEVDRDVADIVYEGVLKCRKLHAVYQARGKEPKEYDVHPLGLIVRDSVIYLICTLRDYPDILQLALHRFKSAELLEDSCNIPEVFDLDNYVTDGNLGYPVSDKEIKIELLFDKDIARHLMETPISEDQKVVEKNDNTVLIKATVKDSLELRWWIQGFGANIEVVKPVKLRHELRDIAKAMYEQYEK